MLQAHGKFSFGGNTCCGNSTSVTIISVAYNPGLGVVETVEQLEFLRKNGCKVFQGHLFGKTFPRRI
jgi:sensor c-di-GMP phosphodiesterase-like protein